MTCPRCKCPECKAAAVNAVLRRVVVSRETESIDDLNAQTVRDNREREQWRDTYGERV